MGRKIKVLRKSLVMPLFRTINLMLGVRLSPSDANFGIRFR